MFPRRFLDNGLRISICRLGVVYLVEKSTFPNVGLQWRFKCDAHFKFFFCCECFLFGSLRMDVEVAMHAQMSSMLMLLETPLASSERHLKPLLMSLRLIGFSFSRFLLQ